MPSDIAPLWTPSPERIAQSRMTDYMQWLAREKRLRFDDYHALWQWSVDDLDGFWESIWQYFDVQSPAPYSGVLADRRMPGASWFPGARLNLAQQAFRFHQGADGKNAAIVAQSELRAMSALSWDDLRSRVTSLANVLRALGVTRGDRVVAYLPAIPETVIAFLACAAIGAVWSSCSPDMGEASVLDRFRQIDPKLLIAVDGYRYGGKDFDRRDVVRKMREALPTLEHTVLLPYLDAQAELPGAQTWDALFAHPAARETSLQFEQVPFDHPLFIVYSSGTTGMPKPIVHGHGGILLESLKSNALHLDLGPEDRFHWFSTTGWIMWNVQVSGLLVGATICLYDGNPGYPDMNVLWKFASESRASFVGAGAAYFANCMKADVHPARNHDLSHLRGVGATGSPLSADGYEWIYREAGRDVLLAVISGGTDVAAAFVGAVPVLPLYSGEMQARHLGVAAEAWDDDGKPLVDAVGELVVTRPMPTMPLFFWNDPGNERYLASYFDVYPGVWRHGDWIRFTPRGGAVIYGRSDTTINRHGVRMGTAEIYRVVEEFDEVLDSLVVDLEYLGRESYMPLFVVLRQDVQLDASLKQRINERIRAALSARHMPNEIIAVDEIPRTLTGKKMELPVKKLLLGTAPGKVANPDAMANPGSLDFFAVFARRRKPG